MLLLLLLLRRRGVPSLRVHRWLKWVWLLRLLLLLHRLLLHRREGDRSVCAAGGGRSVEVHRGPTGARTATGEALAVQTLAAVDDGGRDPQMRAPFDRRSFMRLSLQVLRDASLMLWQLLLLLQVRLLLLVVRLLPDGRRRLLLLHNGSGSGSRSRRSHHSARATRSRRIRRSRRARGFLPEAGDGRRPLRGRDRARLSRENGRAGGAGTEASETGPGRSERDGVRASLVLHGGISSGRRRGRRRERCLLRIRRWRREMRKVRHRGCRLAATGSSAGADETGLLRTRDRTSREEHLGVDCAPLLRSGRREGGGGRRRGLGALIPKRVSRRRGRHRRSVKVLGKSRSLLRLREREQKKKGG